MVIPIDTRNAPDARPREPGQRYDAFVSYSHVADRVLAKAIQSALHSLGKPWYRLRALHVFRDDTSLAANPALWTSIEEALNASRYLIILASPEAGKSTWVAREIEHWRRYKSMAQFLIVHTGGAMAWNENAGDFDWEGTDALPPVLEGAFAQQPRHVDLRWTRGETALSLREARFQDAMADLAAPLHGRPKDEIFGEDARQRRSTMRLARAAVATLAILLVAAVIAGYLAIVQRDTARRERDLALSRQLAASAELTRGDRLDLSLLLGLHAHRFADTPEARSAILQGIQGAAGVKLFLPREVDAHRAIFSTNGRLLAVMTSSSIELREPGNGGLISRLNDPEEPGRSRGFLTGAAFHPEGAVLAASHHDGLIQLWDVSRGRPLGAAFSGRGKDLVPYSSEPERWAEMDRQAIRDVAFAPDGKRLAAVDGAANLFVWAFDRADVDLVYASTLPSLPKGASTVGFLSSSRVLVTGPGAAHFVNPNDNTYYEMESALKVKHGPGWKGSSDDPLLHFTARPTVSAVIDTWLVSGGEESVSLDRGYRKRGVVVVWREGRRESPVLLYTGAEASISAASLSPDRSRLIAGDQDGRLWTWDFDKRERIEGPVQLHGEGVADVTFHPNEAWVASVGADGSLAIRDLDPAGTTLKPPSEFTSTARSVRFSSDGRLMAVGHEDGSVQLWDAGSFQRLHRIVASTTAVIAVRFLHTNDGLIVGTAQGEIGLWTIDARTKPTLRRRFGAEDRLVQLALSSDDRMLAASNASHKITLWELESGRRLQVIQGGAPSDTLAFENDGAFLLADRGWNLERHAVAVPRSGTPPSRDLQTLQTQLSGGIQSIALSPDGGHAALGGWSGEVLLIALRDWKAVFAPARGHDRPVGAVAFSPDGRVLVSAASADSGVTRARRLQLWDVATMQRIGDAFVGVNTPVWDMALNANGTLAALAGGDGSIRLVNIDIRQWIEVACAVARRELTPAEWNQYVGSGTRHTVVCDRSAD